VNDFGKLPKRSGRSRHFRRGDGQKKSLFANAFKSLLQQNLPIAAMDTIPTAGHRKRVAMSRVAVASSSPCLEIFRKYRESWIIRLRG
jgi:hypothetical protein